MTLGPDILLDPETRELVFVDGDLVVEKSVTQSIWFALATFRGEFFSNRQVGTRYFEIVFVKPLNIQHVDAEFRGQILRAPGVLALLAFQSSVDAASRSYTASFSVQTEQGEISDTVEALLAG